MELSFRLAQILERLDAGGRGIIKRITDNTSLERHQVSAMLKNKVQYVSLQALSEICDYLIKHHDIDPATLPGLLFEHDPDSFYALLTRRRRIDVCFGARTYHEDSDWVTASDCILHGCLLQAITNVRDPEGGGGQIQFDQFLVPAYSKRDAKTDYKKTFEAARGLFNGLERQVAGHGLVCLGSVKSNPVTEMVFARIFRREPFKEDKVRDAKERGCPFFFAYRPDDVKPPSCAGGTRLTSAQKSLKPGLYYELEDRTWRHCPCDESHDAGLVVYRYQPALGCVELVLCGFTARSTLSLGGVIEDRKAELWPPQFSGETEKCGVFVVTFGFPEGRGGASARPSSTEIHPLPPGVLARRLGP
jgi:hypothetical protein